MSPTKSPIIDLETDEDGWIRGSSQSIHARKPQSSTYTSPPPATTKTTNKPSPITPARNRAPADDAKPRSLLERIEMDEHLQQTPPPKPPTDQHNVHSSTTTTTTPSPSSKAPSSPFRTTPSQGIRRPGAKIPSPLPLTSPARNNESSSSLSTRTPLSASHPIPETPLKLSQRGGPQTPATPHYPSYPNSAQSRDCDASRASGLGIGLTPLKTPVPLAPSPDNVRSPLNEALNLRSRAAPNASIGSPLKCARNDLHTEPLALGSSCSSSHQSANGQIDAMLDRLRNARSGLGTSASIWAPKSTASSADTDATANASSTSTTSHTIGSGFSSSNLLGVHTGLDRKRPGHRPNGLQLSLGQEISVMQELEEKAEEDYPASTVSSATVGETFRIHPPDHDSEHQRQDDWHGTVVPPTPALGCDSPSSDEDHASSAKPPSRSLDAFGWGTHPTNEPRKSSLFSNLPSSSTFEASWSGDDDDQRKDDLDTFQDMHDRAKASSKEKRNTNYGPLPPPLINYAKSRTPSPTHPLLAKSPQLDEAPRSPLLSAPKLGTDPSNEATIAKANGQRLSPASARSQLPSDDSDGDADVENDRPKAARDRKATKKPTSKGIGVEQEVKSSSPQLESATLEKKRSLKRDKSERIRGRRASQSKEKDVDKVKMPAAAPSLAATVSLPSCTLSNKHVDQLVGQIEDVDLSEKTAPNKAANASACEPAKSNALQQTPLAQRMQSIPAVKDDLFSSPAQPRVELPGHLSATSSVQEVQQAKEVVPATPEPSHAKTFDWAADDDEMDDELPDLDDWGVTLSPAKPSVAASADVAGKDSNASTHLEKHGRKPKSDGEAPWRKAVESKARQDGQGRRSTSGAKGGIKDFAAPKANAASLGIRIAGRANCGGIPAEAEAANELPPATTPYGRWNKRREEISIKGVSDSVKVGANEEGGKGRPRIAADLGALAKLLAPAQGDQARTGGKANPDNKKPKQDAPKKGNVAVGTAAQSAHVAVSAAASIHAPTSSTAPKIRHPANAASAANKSHPAKKGKDSH